MRCKWSIRAGVYSCATALFLILAFIASQGFNAPIFARGNETKPAGAAKKTAAAAAHGTSAASQASADKQHVIESYSHIPLSFEPNQGQTNSKVKFISRGAGYTFFLTQKEAVLSLQGGSQKSEARSQKQGTANSDARVPNSDSRIPAVIRMKLLGANANPVVQGEDELPGESNYFIGNDPKKWRTGVPNYAKVRLQDVYPGIDLVYYGNQQQLEYDWVVKPGADPAAVRFVIGGAKAVRVNKQGDLEIQVDTGELRLLKPVVYQEQESGIGSQNPGNPKAGRRQVMGKFVLLAKNQVGFKVGDYDRSRPLTIDPVLSFSTYLGGSSEDWIFPMALDGSGNIYVSGNTVSTDFPTTGSVYDTTCGTDANCNPNISGVLRRDAFVTKLDPTGSSLIYSTYVGGSAGDAARGLALDGSGDAFITGFTTSADFPTTVGAYSTAAGNLFVTALNSTGTALIYSAHFGGSNFDFGSSIAVDGSGNAYVAGITESTDYPTTVGAFQTTTSGGSCGTASPFTCDHGFVTKLNATGTALVYSTYLGGTSEDQLLSLAIDSSGNAYVAGNTDSADFPTTVGAIQTTFGGASASCDPSSPPTNSCGDAFVSELNAAGSGLVFSTFLGGSEDDGIDTYSEIALDSSGNVYVTGYTTSLNFPVTTGAFQTTAHVATCNNGSGDFNCGEEFVTKLAAGGGSLGYSTYLGGSGDDFPNAIAVDSAGNAYVLGSGKSTDFPLANPIQSTCNGCSGGADDLYITKLDPSGSALVFSTYLGGSLLEQGNTIRVTSAGDAVIAGFTNSTDFPTTVGAFQTVYGHGVTTCSPGVTECADGFVAKLSGLTLPSGLLSPATFNFGSSTVVGTTSSPQAFTLSNVGDAQMTVSGISISPADGQFKIQTGGTCPAPPFTLSAGANCTIEVNFQPFTGSLATEALTVTDDAGNSPQMAALSGTGNVTGPLVGFSGISGNNLAFDPQLVGTASPHATVFINNTGVTTLNILNIQVNDTQGTGDFSIPTNTNHCFGSVPAGISCTFDVVFTPTVTGEESGTVTVTDDAPFSPQTFSVTGTGFAPVPRISLPLSPTTKIAGSATFTLTVNGTGFVPGALVKWNGVAQSTNYVSSNQVTATISSSLVAAEGTALVTVVNPASASAVSNIALFHVTSSTSGNVILNRTDYPAAYGPIGFATGDFNGDGILDLAVAGNAGCSIVSVTSICFPGAVSILTGNGDGTFQFYASYQVGPTVAGIAAGDFNGDHILDLAVTDAQDGEVWLLQGNGDGTFQTATTAVTGTGPLGIAVGDFNGDGILDIVTASNGASAATVILGNGDGTFGAPTDFGAGNSPYDVAVGDFNGDFKPDIAVVNSGADTVSILLGNGDGTFQFHTDYATGPGTTAQGPVALGLGDFNGDGKLDIAVANNSASNVGVLIGNGNGTFATASTYTTGSAPGSISIGDFDGDGILDIGVVNQSSDNVTILFGAGNGFFSSITGYSTGSGPYTSIAGDFNRDGRLDLIAGNFNDQTVSVMAQEPNASTPTSFDFGDQVVGNSNAAQDLTLSNVGTAPLAISSLTIQGTNASEFAISGTTCPLTSQPSGCSATAGFYNGFALGASPFSGVLYVTAPNGNGDRLIVGTPTLGVSGFLGAVANVPLPSASNQEFCDFVQLAPTLVAFAYVPTAAERGGDFSAFDGLLIDPSTGLAVPGGILSPSTSTFWAWRIPANAFRTNGVAPFGGCNISVKVTPTTTGPISAQIVIANNSRPSGGPLRTEGLFANGVAPVAALAPPSLTFASTAVGVTSSGQTVTLTNGPGSTAALNIASIALTGTNPGDYQISPGTTPCPVPGALPIGASCDFVVTFKPTAGGSRTAAVTITDDAPGGFQTVPLSGVGSGNPVPLLNKVLNPTTVSPGAATFTLTATGSGFMSTSTVDWNGTPLATTFVNSSKLTATVPAANVVNAGSAVITVVNPSPGGGVSNYVYFLVATPRASLTFYQFSFLAASDSAIEAGDFNGDGIPDLVFTDAQNGTLGVALGIGNGRFNQPTPQTGFNTPNTLAVGDFNGDGKLDVVLMNGSTITIALGNGDGTFNALTPIPNSNGNPYGLVVADLNGDGVLDLAVTATGIGGFPAGTVNILIGNGDGTFQPEVLYPTGPYCEAVGVGDFNGDGKLDLVTANGNDHTFSILLGNGDGTFGAATNLSLAAGGSPMAIVVADLNGDGVLDFAVAMQGSVTVSGMLATYLGNGDGTFQSPVVSNSTSGNRLFLVVGDFNNDGIPDIGNVGYVQLGNGDGTFQPPLSAAMANAQTAADFDGDGRLDAVGAGINEFLQKPLLPILQISPSSLTFATQAIGTTSSPQTITITNVGSQVIQFTSFFVVTGDFAIDPTGTTCQVGVLVNIGASCNFSITFTPTVAGPASGSLTLTDLATDSPQVINLSGTGSATAAPVAGFNPVSLTFSNQGVGSTSPGQTVTLTNTGTATLTITSLTVTGTNPGDFVVANDNCSPPSGAGSLAVSASCTFEVRFTPQSSGARSASITLNGNAAGSVPVTGTGVNMVPLINLPLVPSAIAVGSGASTVTINGTGFASGATVLVNGSSRSSSFINTHQLTVNILAGDTASAGTLSLVVVNPVVTNGVSNTVFLPVTNPTTSITTARADVSVGSSPTSAVLADVNGDGKLDAIVVNAASDNVSVMLGNGDGTFAAPVNYPVNSNPLQVVVRDFNGDGKPDLAVTNFFSNNISVLLGNGDGTFQAATPYNVGTNPTGIVAGDFNGDGNLDLAVANNCASCANYSVSILIGNGNGTFQTAVNYPVGGNTNVNLATGDLNGDGVLDLVVSTTAGADVLLGNGDGTFQPFTVGMAGSIFAVDLADFNGDGKLDLAAADAVGVLNISLGNGNGTFQAPVNNTVGTNPHAFAVADVNGDGKLDLVSTNFGSSKIEFLLGNGNGTFQLGFDADVGTSPYFVSAGDLNNDGRLDLVVAVSGSNAVSVMMQAPALTLSGANFAGNTLTMPTTPVNLVCTPRTLTLTNTGSASLNVASIVSSDPTTFATTTGTCLSGPIAPGGNCNVTVTFHPATATAFTGTLTISSNAVGSPAIANLAGTGQPACPLASAASTQRLLRGTDRTTFDVEPNPTCQATDQIQLACVNANPATCAFTPGTIQNPQKSLLTMQGLNGVTGNTLEFQVTGTSPDFIQRTLDLAVNFADFWFTPYPTEATVTAGNRATFAVSVVPINGLTGQMKLTCSGAPAGGSCTVSPSVVSVANNAPVQVQVQVNTAGNAIVAPVYDRRGPDLRWLLMMLTAATLLTMLHTARRSKGMAWLDKVIPARAGIRRIPAAYFLLPLLLLIITWASCGGGGTSSLSSPGGTTAGKYLIRMTGTLTPSAGGGVVYDPSAPPLTHDVTMTLNVR